MTSPSHLATPNVPLSRAWNTWTADSYVEMSFLPLGVRVTPLVYAASIARVSRFGPGDEVLFGTHAVDGSRVDARLTHAGTVLDWHYRKASPFDLTGGWRTLRTGEWGLRVWVVLCLSAEDGASLALRRGGQDRLLHARPPHRLAHCPQAAAAGDRPSHCRGGGRGIRAQRLLAPEFSQI